MAINISVILLGLVLTIVLCYVHKKYKSNELLSYIPSVWTSLGILGTFIAIVMSLDNPQKGSFKDVESLIKSIAPAFYTSIFGIIGAIISTLISKIYIAKVELKEETDYKGRFGDNNPEENIALSTDAILSSKITLSDISEIGHQLFNLFTQIKEESVRHHEELIIHLKDQKASSKEFMDSFVSQLEEFYNNLYNIEKEHVEEITNRYLLGIDHIISSTKDDLNEQLRTLIAAHGEDMKNSIEEEKKSLNKVSSELIASIKENASLLNSSINESLSNFTNQNERTRDELSSVLSESRSYFAQIQSENKEMIGEYLAANLEQIQLITNNNLNNLEKMSSALSEVISSTLSSSISNKFDVVIEKNQNLVDNLLQIVENQETRLVENATALNIKWSETVSSTLDETIIGINQSVNTLLSEVETSEEQFIRKLTDVQETKMSEMDKKMVEKYKILNKLVSDQLNEIKDVATNTQSGVKTMTDSVVKTIDDSLKNTISSISKNHLLTQKLHEEILQKVSSLVETLNESNQGNLSVTSQIKDMIPSINNDIKTFTAISEQLKLSKNQFDELLAVIRQLANKNIQFQYELSQMTREHKSVLVNDTEGTKQCPECHTDNPIDAMYCRKCATSFWITKPVEVPASKKTTKKGSKKTNESK